MREDPDRIQLITKRLYPDAGHRFGISAVSVEWAANNFLKQLGNNLVLQFRPSCLSEIRGYCKNDDERVGLHINSPLDTLSLHPYHKDSIYNLDALF